MLRREPQFSGDARNRVRHGRLRSLVEVSRGVNVRSGSAGLRSTVLLVALALLLGGILAACSSSNGANSRSQAQTGESSTNSPTPAAGAAATPGTATGPQAQPKAAQVAQPKKIIPAPEVTASGNGPRIAFKVEEADFGNVQFGEIVRYAFEFRNVGKEPLTITKVQINTLEGC